MPVYLVYRDFFRFLKTYPTQKDKWKCYQQMYLHPHQRFLRAYWKNFPHLDDEQLKLRVEAIKDRDYAQLRALLKQYNLPAITCDTIKKCRRLLPAPDPAIYLFVGFHSSEGFVISIEGQPVMGFGLERFVDFNQIDLLVAHEYYHYVTHCQGEVAPADNIYEKLTSEGRAVAFSMKLLPKRPAWRHVFLSKRNWSWCRQHEDQLLALACSDKATPATFFGGSQAMPGLPPKTGYYVGYMLLRKREE